jgi:hypothetical protein
MRCSAGRAPKVVWSLEAQATAAAACFTPPCDAASSSTTSADGGGRRSRPLTFAPHPAGTVGYSFTAASRSAGSCRWMLRSCVARALLPLARARGACGAMTPSALRCGVPRPACVAAARASRLGAWATRPGGACVLRCAAATSSYACFVCKRSSGARRCAPRLRPRRRADDRHGQGPEEGQDEGRGGQPVQGHGQPAADILRCERGFAAAACVALCCAARRCFWALVGSARGRCCCCVRGAGLLLLLPLAQAAAAAFAWRSR